MHDSASSHNGRNMEVRSSQHSCARGMCNLLACVGNQRAPYSEGDRVEEGLQVALLSNTLHVCCKKPTRSSIRTTKGADMVVERRTVRRAPRQ